MMIDSIINSINSIIDNGNPFYGTIIILGLSFLISIIIIGIFKLMGWIVKTWLDIDEW